MNFERPSLKQSIQGQEIATQKNEQKSVFSTQDIEQINWVLNVPPQTAEESAEDLVDTKSGKGVQTGAEEWQKHKQGTLNLAVGKIGQLPNADKLLKLVKSGDTEIIAKYDTQRRRLLEQGVGASLMTPEEKQEYYDAQSRKNGFVGFLRDQYGIGKDASREIYDALIARSKKQQTAFSESRGEKVADIQERRSKDARRLVELRKEIGLAGTKPESAGEITKEILSEAEKVQIRPEDKNEKGQLLVFPGGPVSNLPERQWKMARTKKFREWFGDWESLPAKSFKTAQGSIYTYDAEGKTTRFKTATGEQHERQDMTVFVNLSVDEEQDFLHAYRVEGESNRKAGVYVVEQKADDSAKILGDVSQVTNPDKIYLAIVKDNKITQLKKASLRPTNGWNSFDTRQFEKNGEALLEVHLGNKVVEIEYDTSKVSKVLDKNGEPLVLGNDDGTTSFVRMKNPFDTNAKYIKNWMEQNKLTADLKRFDKFMDYLKSQGYDGLMVGGRPARDSATGKYGCDELQILRTGSSEKESREAGENPIELVESSALETIKKFDLAQLLLGRKQAAHLGSYDVVESDEHRKQLEKEMGEEYQTITELLNKLGLSFQRTSPAEDNGIYGFSLFIAKNQENLAKAVEADETKNDKEFGVLMGYPKTAVDAYQTENAFDLKAELPKAELDKLEKEEVLAFLEFMPSKGHWREELDAVRETQRLLKEKAPELYDEIVEERKKKLRESVEYDIPADAEMLVEYAKTNFGKFAEYDSKSFKEMWTDADLNHFKQYMTISLRTMFKDHSGEETYQDNVKSVCRTPEERLILQKLLIANGGSAMSLEEFDKQPFSKVARESLGVNVEEVDKDYFQHFNRE